MTSAAKVQATPGLLICGTSHVGKSTLATDIGNALGWPVFSTDKMGRHPGRPWENAPPHVLEFYRQLSASTIYTLLRHHHDNMWPGIKRFITDKHNAGQPFVLEGSALRPEYLEDASEAAICLYADAAFLRGRMEEVSSPSSQSSTMRTATEAFIARSLTDNAELEAAARKVGINRIDAQDVAAIKQLEVVAEIWAKV